LLVIQLLLFDNSTIVASSTSTFCTSTSSTDSTSIAAADQLVHQLVLQLLTKI
jgi:hypothetical protein